MILGGAATPWRAQEGRDNAPTVCITPLAARGAHPGLDLVYRQLGPRLRRGADVLGSGLVALFAIVVLVYGGCRLVLMTLELDQLTAALGWPMAVVYSVVPVAGILLALFAMEALLAALRAPAEEWP